MAGKHCNGLPVDWDRGADGLARLRTADGLSVVIKRRRAAPPDFFAAEARGLAELSAAPGPRSPRVLGLSPVAIALEDLGSGRPSRRDWENAGAALARQHACRGAAFGFMAAGYIGDTPQDNTPDTDGHRFFAERRLLPLALRARGAGWLDGAAVRRIETIASRLPALLPKRLPVLLHGDLWMGNLHACGSGELALIDAAAVHHGWAATDLSMLVLFGGPPRVFFDAYVDAGGLSDWQDQADLLNLYHLLNHLCLFGAGYRAAVLRVVGRYG